MRRRPDRWRRVFRPSFQNAAPDIAVRAEIGLNAELMQGLVEGRLDIGIMYTPQSRPGLKVERLLEERLVLVSTDPSPWPEPGPGYVYIDWGPELFRALSRRNPLKSGLFCFAERIGALGHIQVRTTATPSRNPQP